MDILDKQSQWPSVLAICKTLKTAGFEAWLAGGCVRDGLLGIPPKDFDVATNARPEVVERLFPKTVSVGKAFGVIRVVDADGDVEVATFRHDAEYKDGRRPVGVVFCTPEEDALRRDFTVNALFYDPIGRKIHDFVHGEKDLKKRTIRTVGAPEERFREDHLRLLRAARFSAQLDFEIEEKTYQAMRALHAELTGVSPERIREEMTKLLLSRRALRGLGIAESTGLLFEILPELGTVYQKRNQESDQWSFSKLLIEKIHALGFVMSPEDVWIPLLQAADHAPEVLSRLKFSNKQTEKILHVLKFQKSLLESGAWTRAQTLLFYNAEHGIGAIRFFETYQSLMDPGSAHAQRAKALSLEIKNFRGLPAPLIVAEDLIQLGHAPGKAFGEILKRSYEAQLNLEFGSKTGALDWLKNQSESFKER